MLITPSLSITKGQMSKFADEYLQCDAHTYHPIQVIDD